MYEMLDKFEGRVRLGKETLDLRVGYNNSCGWFL